MLSMGSVFSWIIFFRTISSKDYRWSYSGTFGPISTSSGETIPLNDLKRGTANFVSTECLSWSSYEFEIFRLNPKRSTLLLLQNRKFSGSVFTSCYSSSLIARILSIFLIDSTTAMASLCELNIWYICCSLFIDACWWKNVCNALWFTR